MREEKEFLMKEVRGEEMMNSEERLIFASLFVHSFSSANNFGLLAVSSSLTSFAHLLCMLNAQACNAFLFKKRLTNHLKWESGVCELIVSETREWFYQNIHKSWHKRRCRLAFHLLHVSPIKGILFHFH